MPAAVDYQVSSAFPGRTVPPIQLYSIYRNSKPVTCYTKKLEKNYIKVIQILKI